MKKISIIIATFNAAKTLQRCLDSIANQKNDDIEILIIDGASSDCTIEIVKKNENLIDVFLSEKDRGIYDAWNKGIKRATGEWIVFLGADDVLMEQTIEKQLQYINTHDTNHLDIISAKAHIVDKSGKLLRNFGDQYSRRKFVWCMNISHGSTLHNRKLFNEVGLFDVNFKICGDYELLMRKNLNADFIDDFFIIMQDGGMSTTLKARKEAYWARRKNKVFPFWLCWILFQREKWGYIVSRYRLK